METLRQSIKAHASGAEAIPLAPVTGGASPVPSWRLADALRDISEARATAEENGFPIPTGEMLAVTESLLRRLYELYPHRYSVYPSAREEMVIYARPELGRSIMLVCHADGGSWCYVCLPGESEPISFDSEDTVSDDTLRKAVETMRGSGGET